MTGNYKTLRKVLLLKKLLPQLGLESERLRLEWVSAAEGQRFAQVITDFTEEVKKLGPNPWKGVPHAKIEAGYRAGVNLLRV